MFIIGSPSLLFLKLLSCCVMHWWPEKGISFNTCTDWWPRIGCGILYGIPNLSRLERVVERAVRTTKNSQLRTSILLYDSFGFRAFRIHPFTHALYLYGRCNMFRHAVLRPTNLLSKMFSHNLAPSGVPMPPKSSGVHYTKYFEFSFGDLPIFCFVLPLARCTVLGFSLGLKNSCQGH